MRSLITSLIVLATICPLAYAAGHEHPERWYQERWCSTRGEMEVVMPDQSRADCANATHVVEFDFGTKWAESIGQSLNYGAQAGKRPGIVLILEQPNHMRYLLRVMRVRAEYNLPLDLWAVDRDGQELALPEIRR